MLPYFEQPKLHLGPLTIHAFGALVAIGILLAFRLIRRRAPGRSLDPVVADKLAMRMVIVGFIVAHVFDSLAYYPEKVWANPLTLLFIWQNISSFGGFLGAILVAFWFLRRHRPGAEGWRYLDLIAWSFPPAWLLGRLGCTVAYDHPGLETTFFLGQRYSDHLVRHNLGFYEALCIIPIVALFQWVGPAKANQPGYLVGLLALCYAPVRFLLDFLRIDDARYFGFTPGQYSSVLLAAAGILIMRKAIRRAGVHEPAASTWAAGEAPRGR